MPKRIGTPQARFALFDPDATSETYIIAFFVIRKGVRLKMAIGEKVHPENWDFKAQRVRAGKRFNASRRGEINDLLGRFEKHCLDIYERYGERTGVEFFKEQLKQRLERDKYGENPLEQYYTLLSYARHYCLEVKPTHGVREGTLKNYRKVLGHLEQFAKESRTSLEFPDVGKRFFYAFVNWLYAPPRNHSINSASRMVRWVREIITAARKEIGANVAPDYADFKVRPAATTEIIFTFEELAVFEALDLSADERLDKTRDLFLIGCFTGLRWSDFSRLTPAHILTREGVRLIQITAKKTSDTVVIPIHPTLEKVLAKRGYRSPRLSNQKFNEYIKELARLAGFTDDIVVKEATGGQVRERTVQRWEMVKSHTCRRSFASNYYHKHPEMIAEIMSITGHKTEKQFRAYIISDQIEGAVRFAHTIAKQ